MGRPGRPSKLTEETTKKLVKAIESGNYMKAACAYAGIDYTTFRLWMKKGEKAKSGRYFNFFHTIKRAEQVAEVKMVEQWQRHMPENWQAIATFMERRYPDRWGRNMRVNQNIQQEVRGQVTERHEYDVIHRILADPEARETARELFRKSINPDVGIRRTK
jgi:hypothetical protein